MSRLIRVFGSLAVLAAAVLFAPLAATADTGPDATQQPLWLATGGSSGVWLVQRDNEQATLGLVTVQDGQQSIRRVQRFAEFPILMTGLPEGPLLVFQERQAGNERIYPLRQGRFRISASGQAITGSLEAMPPFRTGDRVVAAASASGRAYLLTSSEDVDQGASLYALVGRAWLRVEVPIELSDASLAPSSLRLMSVGDRLRVLLDGQDESFSVLWTLGEVNPVLNDPHRLAANWSSVDIPIGLRSRASMALGLGDDAVVLMEDESGLDCLVLRRQGAMLLARLEEKSLPESVQTDGARLWLFYSTEDSQLEAVVLAKDGQQLAEGPLQASTRSSGGEGALFLLLVAWSLVISVMVMMMPQNRHLRIVLPPDGYVLAEPSRRLFAAIIDLLPGMVLTSLMWGKPLVWWLSPLSEIIAADGSAPLFTLACLTFVYVSIGDGIFGRTLGKQLTCCRTIIDGGGVPGLRVGAMRSFLKVFCPPLVVVLLLMPYAPSPWSFGTVVVRRDRETVSEE